MTCPQVDAAPTRRADTPRRSTASSKAKQLAALVLSPSPPPPPPSIYRPYFWNSQSLLSRGQTWRALSHLEMQWKWKACCETVSREPPCRRFKKKGSTYVADSPSDCAFFARGRSLVRLALDAYRSKNQRSVLDRTLPTARAHTQIHDVVSANGTVVNDDIPCPKSHSVPLEAISKRRGSPPADRDAHLLYFEALLAVALAVPIGSPSSALLLDDGCGGGRSRESIGHIDVGHGVQLVGVWFGSSGGSRRQHRIWDGVA